MYFTEQILLSLLMFKTFANNPEVLWVRECGNKHVVAFFICSFCFQNWNDEIQEMKKISIQDPQISFYMQGGSKEDFEPIRDITLVK